MRPRLSIVIVTYNSRADIDRCLSSLVEHPAAIDHEIVVVDNASTDGTAADMRQRWTGARVIDAGANLGFARANNLGIQQTRGELILLLNPDTIAPAGSIDRLIAALDARPDAAIAGPRLVNGDGRAELSFWCAAASAVSARWPPMSSGSRVGRATLTGSAARACSSAGRTLRPRA